MAVLTKTATIGGDAEMGGSFEELLGAKRLEARMEWESSVFDPAVIDSPSLTAYLECLFVNKKKCGILPERFTQRISKALRTVLQTLHSSALIPCVG